MEGTLYVVATPIGHLEDITLRALRLLRDVDLIACEDTRQTGKLLARHEIETPTISYHQHNERRRSRQLVGKLKQGTNIALVCDAGVPTISDPGTILIRNAIAEGIAVVPLPGPSAAIAALMAAGMSNERFLFVGFLPPKQARRRRDLESLNRLPYTLVIYEAPHRIRVTLKDALEILGDRWAVLARELTKVHEEFDRGRLSQLLKRLVDHPVKGEIVLLVAGVSQSDVRAQQQSAYQDLSVGQHVKQVIQSDGVNLKAAMRKVAGLRGLSKNEVYKEVLKQKTGPSR